MAPAIDWLDVRTWPNGHRAATALPTERIGGRAIERVALLDGTLWIRVTESQILFCLIVRRLLIGFSFSLLFLWSAATVCDSFKAAQLAVFDLLADAN